MRIYQALAVSDCKEAVQKALIRSLECGLDTLKTLNPTFTLAHPID